MKPIYGYEDQYLIDEDGNVFSKHSKRIIKASKNKTGYLMVGLWHNNKGKTFTVHRLVALTYIGAAPGPTGKGRDCFQVDHIDNNKLNNHYSNLQWITGKENFDKAILQGSFKEINRSNADSLKSPFTHEQIADIRLKASQGKLLEDLAKDFNSTYRVIRKIVRGLTYKSSPGLITLGVNRGYLYKITSPQGEEFEATSLAAFERSQNLSRGTLDHIAVGRSSQNKEWKVRKYKDGIDVTPLCGTDRILYTITDPQKIQYTTHNLSKFCKDFEELNYNNIVRFPFTTKQYKGWTITRTDLSKQNA